ncbi:HAD domain-containing protein [Pseudarthrobacter sp. efr-133-R2A-89]|uniref:HAD domain-containing protein n=1 Tax=Pseudarthrobacter sp. efr-133-R2A-89 TaxID=3040302 RepID=UPI002556BAE4|nr:HAD domain-containing protein [Pseudarthrobacter sp. efr-133-R2A-89]
MELIILLDIDGVLNPSLRGRPGAVRPDPVLSCEKKALVRRLSRCGRIAWVSTWPVEMTAAVEEQLELEVSPLRVPLLLRPADGDEPTPKLRSVSRWLARMDDVLEPDAGEWSYTYRQAVLLQKPDPNQGLTEEHVVTVEEFAGKGGVEPPTP